MSCASLARNIVGVRGDRDKLDAVGLFVAVHVQHGVVQVGDVVAAREKDHLLRIDVFDLVANGIERVDWKHSTDGRADGA